MKVYLWKYGDELLLAEHNGHPPRGTIKTIQIRKKDWEAYKRASEEWSFQQGWLGNFVSQEQEEALP